MKVSGIKSSIYNIGLFLVKWFGAPGKAWCFQRVQFPSLERA
jgi:hypothetical protein